jgi:BlaI family transcriptional regulator, penicillinase repressor
MPPKLSDANFEIMKVVWEKGETTVLDVMHELNIGRKHKLKRASVQVMLTRLEKYGWVTHREEERTFYYRALREQNSALRDILKDLKDRIFGGSERELVKCLFEESKISPAELDRIATLLKSKNEE